MPHEMMLHHPRIIDTYLIGIFHLLNDIVHSGIQTTLARQVGGQIEKTKFHVIIPFLSAL